LQAHPGVEIISRDRGGSYAEGARRGAPTAVQVADRWHLLANLRDTVERLLIRKHADLPSVPCADGKVPKPAEASTVRDTIEAADTTASAPDGTVTADPGQANATTVASEPPAVDSTKY